MHTKKENAPKRLTADELRKFKGFENYNNEKDEETIRTFEILLSCFTIYI